LTSVDLSGKVLTTIDRGDSMARIQLALNVADLDQAVTFYSKLFGTSPAKLRPGYANFAIAQPPLKLVLIEGEAGGSLNHLGIEVDSTEEVSAAQSRLAGAGLATATEDNVACCYARQDKVWVDDPDGAPWEIYTVLEDVEMVPGQLRTIEPVCGPGACDIAEPAVDCCSAGTEPASCC
jgi:catechol 2,3-dioxygenase-like lactoylglutathione lyase family enzyme